MPDWILNPPILLAIVYVLGGLWGLAKGGDLLVDGAVSVAKKAGLAPAVIGATIVAFGTSAPELVVSLSAAFDANAALHAESMTDATNVALNAEGITDAAIATMNPDGLIAIAMANVVGSNICNLGLILGISLLIGRAAIPKTTRRLDMPALIVATIALISLALPWGGEAIISRFEAMALFALLLIYVTTAVCTGAGEAPAGEAAPRPWLRIFGGLFLLLIAGRLCLAGAVSIATELGMSQRVIGLTVVAAGTSLPELFASLQAARKGFTDIAIANVIGSNIFNTLCIVGITGTIVPLPLNAGTLGLDIWVMAGFVAFIIPGMLFCKIIGRGHGIVLITGYVGYTIALLTL